ncbi:DegT/DnrJ/EryC1/StrS family aminotransferase [Leeuwenhoekiella sp. NPDC079379]|uniref:DegT/DnrJ/EryC1/StrS family aminotransferase n=1 Tax=Leeuwenhoekiella sp. NPDC079379 TaxID=3364122 RepID=UPI0037C8A0A8
MIPFLDLQKVNTPYTDSFKKRFDDFLQDGTFILGKTVTQFELEFAEYCNTSECIGTGTGFDSLRLIFEGLKLQKKLNNGDSVIVAANSYIATVLAILQAGLKPVFVEVEEQFFNIDLQKIVVAGASVKAVLITHLYGQLEAVEAISTYAKKYNLLLIEDASQAHGAHLKGQKAGSFGVAAAFSCYPTKNLGALGDAGLITTSDATLAEIIKKLRNYGRSSSYENEYAGFNSRLDPLQAIFLSEKLNDLDAQNTQRRSIAARYAAEINNEHIKLPLWDLSENHVFYVYVIRVKNRSHFLMYLESCEVGFALHYPIPPYRQAALKDYNSLSFPITETLANESVSIPLNTTLTESEITIIIAVLNAYNA